MGIRKTRVGILTFSDGRKYIHETLVDLNQRYQDRLAAALEATGEVEVVGGREIIWTPEGVDQIRKYAAMDIGAIRSSFLAGMVAPASSGE